MKTYCDSEARRAKVIEDIFFLDNGDSTMLALDVEAFSYQDIIRDICELRWEDLTEEDCVRAAWAYYFFSVQFRENLQTACELFPEDPKLQQLHREECATDNLSPWPGVAEKGERMDHDEFMRRSLTLAPVSAEERAYFHAHGAEYLSQVRGADAITRALSIASYEDGGLEQVFRAMAKSPTYDNPVLLAFRHFILEHIKFDSDPDQGHGALSRHMKPDDRIVPMWSAFKNILVKFAPPLSPPVATS
jgi:hypothetical protein